MARTLLARLVHYTGLLLTLLCGTFLTIEAQQLGEIGGAITDYSTGDPLAGVQVRNTAGGGAFSLGDGQYLLSNLKPGSYTLIFNMFGYRPDTVKDIRVTAGKRTSLDIKLVSEAIELEGVEIQADRTVMESSDIAMVATIQNSSELLVGISKEQIGRSQDRNAAQVLRRVPGLSLNDNRFVSVRGLNQRYSVVQLNNALTPSLEPDIRSFSFDILPAGMIDQITVAKAPAPHLPGDFAGGAIQIKTLTLPEKDVLKLGYKTSFRLETTGKDFLQDPAQEASDYLGFDQNRGLPEDFPEELGPNQTTAEQAAQSRRLGNTWGAEQSTAIPDQRFNLLFAKNLKTQKPGLRVATTTALRYTITSQIFQANRLAYLEFDSVQGFSDTIFDYQDRQYTLSTRIGLLHNWTVQLPKNHTFLFNVLFHQNGVNTLVDRFGQQLERTQDIRNTSTRYRSRRLLNTTLQGRHKLLEQRLALDWTLGFAQSGFDEPDYRSVEAARVSESQDSFLYNPPFQVTTFERGGRFFATLREFNTNGQVNARYTLRAGATEQEDLALRLGAFWEYKDREFDARWFNYLAANNYPISAGLLSPDPEAVDFGSLFAPENLNDSTGLFLEEGTRPSDSYAAQNLLTAGYAALQLPLPGNIRLYGGVRLEYNRQTLNTANRTNDSLEIELEQLIPLPSLNASWRFRQAMQLRLAYGLTVNRPEFRELAPFSYFDFYQNNTYRGNPDLQNAVIHNLDLRWEWYPGIGDMITVGVFYKKFFNPIEWAFVPVAGGGGIRNFEAINAQEAYGVGAELEVRKALEGWVDQPFLRDLTVMLNVSYLYTQVTLGEQDAFAAENPERSMQGQSPYLVNAGLQYDLDEYGLQTSVFYNVFGPRLFVVGNTLNPDIYEMPRHQLDLTISKTFGKHWKLSFGMKNLLDAVWELRQDRDRDGQLEATDEAIEFYTRGQYFTLGINWTL